VVAALVGCCGQRAARYVYLSTVNAYKGLPDEPLTDESAVYDPTLKELAARLGAAEGMAPTVGEHIALFPGWN
jgi:hypothetical protein